MFKKKVEELIENALKERQDLFLLSLDVTLDNAIKVVVDGDNGVLVEDCIFLSRAIEHNLDRDEQDFSLQVLSAGATEPLVLPRQYKKHIGRHLEIKNTDGNRFEGKLATVDADAVELEWKAREPKPIGKGKVTVTKSATIPFQNIDEAKVKIKF